MTYGTIRSCGVVVCDDIWDAMDMRSSGLLCHGTLQTCGVVVSDDIWDTEGCSGLR